MAKKATARGKPTAGARPVLQFRVHDGLYEALKAHAAEQKLTISEAAADILSKHMADRELFPGVQKTMMWLSSGFWHAAKMKALERGLSTNYAADNGIWMNDAECYRAGALAVLTTLLQSGPIQSEVEKQKTIESIVAGLA